MEKEKINDSHHTFDSKDKYRYGFFRSKEVASFKYGLYNKNYEIILENKHKWIYNIIPNK